MSDSLSVWSYQQREMVQIVPYLFIGRAYDADKVEQLDKNRIRAVVSIVESRVCCPYYWQKNVRVLHRSEKDQSNTDLSRHFTETAKFIHEFRSRQESVLVHCQEGVSRSPTIVIAYLMASCGLSYGTSLALVSARRPCVNPNIGFRRQLIEYEKLRSKADRFRLWQMLGKDRYNEQWDRDRAVVRSKLVTQNMRTSEIAQWFRELHPEEASHAEIGGRSRSSSSSSSGW